MAEFRVPLISIILKGQYLLWIRFLEGCYYGIMVCLTVDNRKLLPHIGTYQMGIDPVSGTETVGEF